MVQELCWQASKQIKMIIIIIIIVIIIIISSSSKMVLDLPTPEGWKATRQCTGRESNSQSFNH